MLFLALKEFQDLCLNKIILIARQHHSCCQHKQGRRHEVRPTVCHIGVNPDLLLKKSDDRQGPTHTRPVERGGRQDIQARQEQPNRVVSPSRGLPVDMHQVAFISNRPIYNEVQQVASLRVISSRLPNLGSRCTQSTFGGP